MLKHGGRFENYFSRDTVTHIICSNLPDSKMRNLRCDCSCSNLFCTFIFYLTDRLVLVVLIQCVQPWATCRET